MYIQIKVIPKSRSTEWVELMADGTHKIRIAAAPEKGKANKELFHFLGKELNISPDEIKIISGHTDTRKLIKVPDDSVIPW